MCAPEKAFAIAVKARGWMGWVRKVCAKDTAAAVSYDQDIAAAFASIIVAFLI